MNSKIQSTMNYDQFKFRDDNRTQINQNHVKDLIKSISSRNMLETRPITVNSAMEVMDGQHRLLAAKELGLPIFYEIDQDISMEHLLLLNVHKSWTNVDRMNYYAKNGYIEYQKLQDYMKKNNISLSVALRLQSQGGGRCLKLFKDGKFMMKDDSITDIETAHEIINIIRKYNGTCVYLNSTKFWCALDKLMKHRNFDLDKLKKNLVMMIDRVGPRVGMHDYYIMLVEIHDWRNTNKIGLVAKEYE